MKAGERRMERITSSQNTLLKHIRKLQTSRAYREACGEFVADGFKLLSEALQWYPHLTAVVLCEGAPCPPLPPQTRCVCVPESLMQSLSSMCTPQGVVFTCALPKQPQLSVCRGGIVLDRIQDPGNLGTILRTADAFGVPVLLTNNCADPFCEKTIRASMGAVLRTPPVSIPLEELLRAVAASGVPLAATALSERARDLRQVDLSEYLTVIGSEGQGVCETLLRAAQSEVIIPMRPTCESLNAAVAASIVMWQLINHRK